MASDDCIIESEMMHIIGGCKSYFTTLEVLYSAGGGCGFPASSTGTEMSNVARIDAIVIYTLILGH